MELAIGQVNCGRASAAAAELRTIMTRRKIDILILQEPYSFRGGVPGFQTTNTLVLKPEAQNPQVALVFNSERVEAFQLKHEESDCVMTTKITTEFMTFYIINVYCKFSLPIEGFLEKIAKIVGRIRQIDCNSKILIAADANASSELWHADSTDARGLALEELVLELDLSVMNLPSEFHTFSTANGASNIDVTLTSANLTTSVYDWIVSPECVTCDHNIILYKIEQTSTIDRISRPNKIITGLATRRTNWTAFEAECRSSFDDRLLGVLANSAPHEAVRILTRRLMEICEKTTPKRRGVPDSVPWWSREIVEARKAAKHKKKALSRARRMRLINDIPSIKLEYRIARNKCVATIRRAKLQSWRNFVATEGNRDAWGIVYKILRNKFRRPEAVCSITMVSGDYTQSTLETLQTMAKKMFPSDSLEPETEAHRGIRSRNLAYRNSNVECDITVDEIHEAISKAKCKKAPGPDGIPNEALKHLWPINQMALYNVFNNALRNRLFPRQWKVADLRIILKSDDRNREDVGSYRPISLLSAIGKIYERIVVARIEKSYAEKNLASDRQFGFKVNRSTEDALLAMLRGIETSEKKYIVAIFADIEGAFDNLWWPAIKGRLVEAECSSTLVEIINSYFSNRKVIMSTKFESLTVRMKRGCPQGSIIGPHAWNWCMDVLMKDIESNMNEDEVESIAYADDLLILVKANSRQQVEQLGARALERVSEWCLTHKLKISRSKTKAMLMKGKLNEQRMPILKIDGQNIGFVDQIKYLGIIVDRRMQFVLHAKYLRDKVTKFVMSIRRTARQEWGLKNEILNTLYRGVFLPIVTYGASVWSRRATNSHVRRHLDAAQRTMLLLLTKACRTTSTSAMQVIAGCLPLDLEVIRQSIISNVRRNECVSWNDYTHRPTENQETADLGAEKKKITEEIMKEWQKRWDGDSHGRTTHEFINKVDFSVKNKRFRPNRELTYILTGYGPINESLFRRGAVDSPLCLSCGTDETLDHMLYDCPMYERFRFGELTDSELPKYLLLENEGKYKRLREFAEEMFKARNTYQEIVGW